MRTNIVIDDQLMKEAMERSGLKTKREVVDAALRTFVRLKRQEDVLELRGIGWDGDLEGMRRD